MVASQVLVWNLHIQSQCQHDISGKLGESRYGERQEHIQPQRTNIPDVAIKDHSDSHPDKDQEDTVPSEPGGLEEVCYWIVLNLLLTFSYFCCCFLRKKKLLIIRHICVLFLSFTVLMCSVWAPDAAAGDYLDIKINQKFSFFFP